MIFLFLDVSLQLKRDEFVLIRLPILVLRPRLVSDQRVEYFHFQMHGFVPLV